MLEVCLLLDGRDDDETKFVFTYRTARSPVARPESAAHGFISRHADGEFLESSCKLYRHVQSQVDVVNLLNDEQQSGPACVSKCYS